ncbi:peptidase S8/S53 domain-containing protein [Mycena rosella]|uniref:Peptidase S8/S53 domain-containing protein n=1 Tax=Mycena rosella TaxID=1033263 RepID=A0AAD7GQK6_MYCRO|nr:peptidase S8/S53 domain-containing protein [Mycena rosella]
MDTSDATRDWPFLIVELTAQAAQRTVSIYVLDLGVQPNHAEFGNRAQSGVDFDEGSDTDDTDGHGARCSLCHSFLPRSLILYSVDRGCGLWVGHIAHSRLNRSNHPRQVASQRQSLSADAIAQAVDNAIDGFLNFKRNANANPAAIISLIIETLASPGLEFTFTQAIKQGIHIMTAAGNKTLDQPCDNFRVSKERGTNQHRFPSAGEPGSNFGPCVEIYAGGRSVQTAGITSDTAITTQDGTSFAAPQVAGLIANKILLSGNKTPAEMKAEILSEAITGKIVGLESGSVNKIAQLLANLLA